MMSFHDWFKSGGIFAAYSMLEEEEKPDAYYNRCQQVISKTGMKIADAVSGIAVKQNPNYIPDDILRGIEVLVLYAFLNVLEKQRRQLSKEQSFLVNKYFEIFSIRFTKSDFIAAAKTRNETRKRIEDLVGISHASAGTFWHIVFKAMTVTKSADSFIYEIFNDFVKIQKNFAILGRMDANTIETICKNFEEQAIQQFLSWKKSPQTKTSLDVFGEISAAEHYQQLHKIYTSLVDRSNVREEFELDVDLSFDLFIVGILLILVKRTNLDPDTQVKIMEDIMKICDIHSIMSGAEIIEAARKNGSSYQFMKQLTSPEDGDFWKIVGIMGSIANLHDQVFMFTKTFIEFILGIGTELTRKYPNSGIADIAKNYSKEAIEIAKSKAGMVYEMNEKPVQAN